jgi:hypothetical protein
LYYQNIKKNVKLTMRYCRDLSLTFFFHCFRSGSACTHTDLALPDPDSFFALILISNFSNMLFLPNYFSTGML